MIKKLFDSQYGKVEYIEEDHTILLTWKEKCSFANYRNTTLAALSGLQAYDQSNLLIDARNGFEDEPEDVQWGFQMLLPAMAKTACRAVVLIMQIENDIEGEMDMWSKEFAKYFKVIRVRSYAEAVAALAGI